VLLLSNMLVNLFKMLIGYGLIFVAMALYRVPLSLKIFWMVPYLGLLFLLSFGLSCILLHCGVYIDDLGNIVNVVLRLLFYLTGVFFNPEKQLEGLVRYLMIRLNPTCYIVTSLRNAMLYNRSPVLSWFVLWGIAGLTLSAVGVHLIYKYERRYVKSV
jgi:ABC-type polysaccharide/polyol phosphate export permease